MTDAAVLDLQGRYVVIVEDDAMIGFALVSYLEEVGAHVLWATGRDEAIHMIEDCERIDIAIVDLNLDGLSSTPVIDRLIDRDIFTVICTGYDESSIAERYRMLPRSEKPFTRSKLRTILTERV